MQVLLRAVKGECFGRRWLLPPGEYVIGRDPECQILLKQAGVTRQHCKLRVTDDSVFVCDLGSRNNTIVANGKVTEERLVKNGDWITVCSSTFRVYTYLSDVWRLENGEPVPCDVPDDFSDDPIAYEDLLAAAGISRPEYLALIEQDRSRGNP